MRIKTFILFVSLFSIFIAESVFAQSNWMIAEKISKNNRWNRPFYYSYNSVDKLLTNRTDSIIYCKDCSLPSMLLKAIKSNEIPIYQLDKLSQLVETKTASIENRFAEYLKNTHQSLSTNLDESIHDAELVIFRRAVSSNLNDLKDLSIEWLAIEIQDTSVINKNKVPFRIYLHAKDCFTILTKSTCQWTHPVNFSYTLSYVNALKSRTYLAYDLSLVSVSNLQLIPAYVNKSSIPALAVTLFNNDQNTSKGIIPFEDNNIFSTNLYAVCIADIRDQKNLGYYKAQLPELLLRLFREKKLKGYNCHEDGYYTPMKEQQLTEHLLVEEEKNNEFVIKPLSGRELYSVHFMKEYYRTSTTVGTKINWLVLGVSTDMSTEFTNNYAIAFKYDDVLSILSKESIMWFNGTNQTDSVRLDEALRTQRIAYKEMFVYTIYGDTILHSIAKPAFHEIRSYDPLSELLYPYTQSLTTDFDASNRRIVRTAKHTISTYNLTYQFNASSKTFLTKNSLFTDLILNGVKENKLYTYQDPSLKNKIKSTDVLYKLDRSRFYKTGNAHKDSIYVSTLSDSARYTSTQALTEFSLISHYSMIDGKESNAPFSFGIIIPADQNPQYDIETLCFVSYPALVHYLSQSKEGKKYIPLLSALLNEKRIIQVTDFYDMECYADTGEEIYPKKINYLPSFIIQHLSGKHY